VLHEDEWGEILDRPGEGMLEIRWYDSTSDIDGQEFNQFLAAFTDFVLDKRRPKILVDATAFKMDPAKIDLEWRNINVIPKYNEAGVERFAFHVPPAMPAVGAPPAPDGPADFPTAWFATRREAIAWLRG
jgi:uncharacterized protein YodC (DUF2158 family)